MEINTSNALNNLNDSQKTRENRLPRISVIVPYHDAVETIDAVLASLSAGDYPDFEIICVNDYSTDDSASIVCGFDVRHASLLKPSGAAIARNLGASMATGEILLFIDADVEVTQRTLSIVAGAFESDPVLSACFGSYTPLPVPRNFASVYKNLVHHYTHQNSEIKAHTFWCGCGAVKRDVFEKIDGFDESYTAASVEDIELGYRLSAEGYRIRLIKSAQVRHAKRYSFLSLIRSDIFHRAVPWTMLMARKNVFYADLNLRPENVVSALILMLFLPLSIAATHFFMLEMAYFVPVIVIAGYLFLNRKIFAFARRSTGFFFGLKFIAMYTATYLYSVIGFMLGILLYIGEKIRGSVSRTEK